MDADKDITAVFEKEENYFYRYSEDYMGLVDGASFKFRGKDGHIKDEYVQKYSFLKTENGIDIYEGKRTGGSSFFVTRKEKEYYTFRDLEDIFDENELNKEKGAFGVKKPVSKGDLGFQYGDLRSEESLPFAEAKEIEYIETEAGEFKAWRFFAEEKHEDNGEIEIIEINFWFAPYLGLVKAKTSGDEGIYNLVELIDFSFNNDEVDDDEYGFFYTIRNGEVTRLKKDGTIELLGINASDIFSWDDHLYSWDRHTKKVHEYNINGDSLDLSRTIVLEDLDLDRCLGISFVVGYGKIAVISNKHDDVHFFSLEGEFLNHGLILDEPDLRLQNVSGFFLDPETLIVSEDGYSNIIKMSSVTGESEVLVNIPILPWLGSIIYDIDTNESFVAASSKIIQFYLNSPEDYNIIAEDLPSHITGLVKMEDSIFFVSNFAGGFYKLDIITGKLKTITSVDGGSMAFERLLYQ